MVRLVLGLKQIWCFAVLYSRSIMRSGSPGRNGEKGPQRRRGLALAHRERGVSEVSKSRCEGCALWGSLSQRAADWANASSCMQLLRKVHRPSRHTVLEATLSLHLEATRRVVLYHGGYKAVLASDACTTRLGGTLLGPLGRVTCWEHRNCPASAVSPRRRKGPYLDESARA